MAALVALLVSVAPGCATEERVVAYQAVLPALDGSQVDFGDLRGQDVVVWFWAPW